MPDNFEKNILENQFKKEDKSANVDALKSEVDVLKAIYKSLSELLKDSKTTSQSNAENEIPKGKFDTSRIFRDQPKAKHAGKSISDGLEDALLESLLGSNFKKELGKSLNAFAKELGVNIKDVPYELGKSLLSEVSSSLSNTAIGKEILSPISNLGKSVSGAAIKGLSSATAEIAAGGSAFSAVFSASATAVSDILPALVSAGPALLAVGAGLVAVELATASLTPAIEGTKKLFEDAGKSFTRYNDQREKQLANQKERLKADNETLIKEPFEILKSSAQEVYNVWDNVVRKINATQGYSKSDLQSLMSNYSARLKAEGLDEVITSASITQNLSSVLDAGLSGRAAEEFAYLATKLNAAIPTQDFFNYANTYSSLAANAIKNGASQTQAIQYANQQLEAFANDVLYASRQLAGGFSTGLKDASSIFQQSVNIATASKTGDPSKIAGVLTSVSAVVGAIAPDLASSITDVIYKAATGGNSSDIVALRSLAGINASNTEFLRKISEDPQSVFATLFTNLSNLQNMSESNYMEVADKLSSVFGLSSEAFQRVDFKYLADAISQMNTNSASLDENIKLLASGETTTSTEQLKMAQINKYMIDEGLAYVLDNEASRAIQEHMWDEQIANKITESTYAVDLQGSALEFLEGIRHTIDNIVGLLNPASWIGRGVADLVSTAEESTAQRADVVKLLELTKVGTGNATSLYQLTTTGTDLHLTNSLISMLGGTSSYELVSNVRKIKEYANKSSAGLLGAISAGIENTANSYSTLSRIYSGMRSEVMSANQLLHSFSSNYKWGTVSKSASAALSSLPTLHYSAQSTQVQSGTSASAAAQTNRVNKMLKTLQEYATALNDDKSYKYSYEDWAKTSRRYGIANLETALKDTGYNLADVKQQFVDYQTKAAAQQEVERMNKEEESWDAIINNVPSIYTLLNETIEPQIQNLDSNLSTLLNNWIEYYVKHTAYLEATRYKSSDYEKIRKQEKKGSDDAVSKLANSLTSNLVDLKDPQVQTNVLLAEILKVMSTIMQQNNNKTTSKELSDSLQGLALGLLK